MKKNVLIFPAGAENAMDIYRSLKYNLHFNVFGASGIRDHAAFVYPEDHLIVDDKLFITNERFFETLDLLLTQYHIDYLIPTHDTIARVLKENEERVSAVIICSPVETVKIAEDKSLMYRHLKDTPYHPKVYEMGDIIEYPVFLKPNVAAGGKGTVKINDDIELQEHTKGRDNYILCEYLPGDEYTVDCFTDKNGSLKFIGPRTRERITLGITYHSQRVKITPEIKEIAEDLNNRFIFRGAWYFQLKKDKNGKMKFMEFSVRQAGTMAFYRQLGVNFALLSLFDFMDYPVDIICNDLDLKLDRAIETLYDVSYKYNTIFLDYDDTLIVNEHVNTTMMQLIYQAFNNNIKFVLLTKHEGDLKESLSKYRISENLFDEIIVIRPGTKKSDYIAHENAVFIDNYFPERSDVFNKCKIPVFDVDAAECLIDKRGM